MTVSIPKAMRPRHAQSARNDPAFGIGRHWLPLQGDSGGSPVTPAERQPRDELLVCHHGLTALALVNPTDAPTTRVVRWSCMSAWEPSSGPEAELLPVKPACSLALRRCGTINRPYHPVACPQAPPARRCPCRRMATPALTCKPLSSSTTGSRGPTLARSIKEQKASQSLPALQAPAPSRAGRRPEATAPRFSFVVHVPSTLASPAAGRSWKRVKAIDLPTRHPMPVPDPAITRARVFHAASGCACPHGLPAGPRSNARHHPGLSVRGGPMRADGAANSRIDPPAGARPDLAADAAARP